MKALRPLTASLMLLTSCLLISNTTPHWQKQH